MDSLTARRIAIQQLGAHAVGRDARQPRDTVGNMRVDGLEADVLALGVDVELDGDTPLQDENGEIYFMTDMDPVDGGTPIL